MLCFDIRLLKNDAGLRKPWREVLWSLIDGEMVSSLSVVEQLSIFLPHLLCVGKCDFPEKSPKLFLMISNSAPLPMPRLWASHPFLKLLQMISNYNVFPNLSVLVRNKPHLSLRGACVSGRDVGSLSHVEKSYQGRLGVIASQFPPVLAMWGQISRL